MASPAKKARTESKTKSFYAKQARKPQRNFLEVGDKGFLVTCNFRERDSIRECYQLLNEYFDRDHPPVEEAEKPAGEDDDDDIAAQLQNQITKTKQDVKVKSQKFQSIETGVQNCVFIRTSIDDPLQLGISIIRDLYETKVKKTKVLLRMLPIQTVCRAKLEDITNAAGELFDKHFLKVHSTFGINFNRRLNNDVSRDEVIKVLADLITMKNPLNTVNLKEPQQSVIVEIVKGMCLLSVVPDYIKLKKYNINELWSMHAKEKSSSQEDKPVASDVESEGNQEATE